MNKAMLTCLLSIVATARLAAFDLRAENIYTELGVGYAVQLIDMNADGQLDILVVDKTRVIWFENPTWKLHTISENQTKPDNVCIAVHDIDGDGKLDLALGADWQFTNETIGTIQWLHSAEETQNGVWKLYPIDTEPFVHRMQWADIDSDGEQELLVVPLLAQGQNNEQRRGRPIRVLAYDIPKDPFRDRWTPTVLSEELHVAHNFWPTDLDGDGDLEVLVASFEGVSVVERQPDGSWKTRRLGEGDQSNADSRGASEIKRGKLQDSDFIATIEPWHGDKVVVYTRPPEGEQLWTRHVLDSELKWGHAVWCANLDDDPEDELIIGVRDDSPQLHRGLRIYDCQDATGEKWKRTLCDKGEVAIEDLAVADLDGDGDNDIVTVGRQTHNVRIYWNE